MIKQPDPQLKKRVLLFLKQNCSGRQNAITKHKLMELLSIADERSFRTIIFNLRMEDIPILSAVQPPYGFYFAKDESETAEALQQIHNRTMKLHAVDKHIRNGLQKQFPGSQIPLDLVS
jgi:hypothetical protein